MLLCEYYFVIYYCVNLMLYDVFSSYNVIFNYILFFVKIKMQLCLYNLNKCMLCCYLCIEI